MERRMLFLARAVSERLPLRQLTSAIAVWLAVDPRAITIEQVADIVQGSTARQGGTAHGGVSVQITVFAHKELSPLLARKDNVYLLCDSLNSAGAVLPSMQPQQLELIKPRIVDESTVSAGVASRVDNLHTAANAAFKGAGFGEADRVNGSDYSPKPHSVQSCVAWHTYAVSVCGHVALCDTRTRAAAVQFGAASALRFGRRQQQRRFRFQGTSERHKRCCCLTSFVAYSLLHLPFSSPRTCIILESLSLSCVTRSPSTPIGHWHACAWVTTQQR